MRPKTKRRLTILLVAVVLVVGGAVLLVQMNASRKNREARAARAAGMVAFEKGDYEDALQQLMLFNSRIPGDADAIYAQAVARSMVVEPQKRHQRHAVELLLRYKDLRPGDLKGLHKLLELYPLMGRNHEALAIADEILKSNPDDLTALRAKANILDSQRKFKEALPVAEKINQLQPLDLDGQRQTYALYAQLKRPGDEVVKRAKEDLARHPQDPRMELLLAIAYDYANDTANAQRMLNLAVSRKAPDAGFVRLATRLLDSDRSFDRSRAFLERAANDVNDPAVLQLLVQRLWQDGEIEEMGKRLEKVDPADPRANTSLLAMKAISLYDKGRTAEARAVVDALAKRPTDNAAYAWSTAITVYYGQQADPKEAISQLQQAANRDRENAVIHLWTGDAYEQLGEIELAVHSWKAAAQLAPAWATPHVRAAKTLAMNGRSGEARAAADQAAQRAPKAMETRVADALSRSAVLADDPHSAGGLALLRIVEELQQDYPNEPQTLPMYVTLLTRTAQKDKAIATVNQAIQPQAKLPLTTMLRLADVSAAMKLGLEQSIYDVAGKSGNSPELALARARFQRAHGQGDKALAALRTAATGAGDDPAAWQLALTQYLDQADPAQAATAWKTLVEKYPKDLRVQGAYLASAAHTADRPTWAATVDRLKQLTREEGVRWRLERARYLVAGEASERDRADAVTLINELLRVNPDLAEPRMMLATLYLKADNRAGAIEQLKKAVDLRPRDPRANLTLARLLQEQGQTLESQSYLTRLSSTAELSPADARAVAQLFADQGQIAKAINVLRSTSDQDVMRDVMLAQLYRRDGRTKEAGDLFTRVSTSASITADAIAAAADFFYDSKQPDRAAKVLTRLEEIKGSVPPGVPFLVRGEIAERYENVETAQSYFVAAVQAANNARTNRELAGFYLRRNDLDKARTAVMAGLAVDKEDASLAATLRAMDALANLPLDQRPGLAQVLSRNPGDTAAAALLKILAAHKDAPPEKRIDALKSFVEQHPRFWPAREQLALAYVAAHQVDQARATAVEAVNTFSLESAPARVLYEICVKDGQWAAAKSAAEQWRLRSIEDPRGADIATATAAVNLGQYEAAANALRPYIAAARENVPGSMDVLWPYSRALLRDGRPAEVTAILGNLAKTDPAVRRLWLALAPDVRPSVLAATAWINQVAEQVGKSSAEQMDLAWAWFSVGQQYEDSACFTRAAALLRQMINKGESTRGNWYLLGEALRGTNDYVGAEEAYRRAIAAGDTTGSTNSLAYLLLLQGKQLSEAVELASKAVADAPRAAQNRDTRGQIYLKLDKPDQALEDFERALAIKPDLIESLVGKAEALRRLGRPEQAKGALQKAEAAINKHPLISAYTRAQLNGVRKALGE